MGLPIGHMIRHIRYEEFVALKSEGAGDFDGFLAAVQALVEQLGDVAAHHVLVDLTRATNPPNAPSRAVAWTSRRCAACPSLPTSQEEGTEWWKELTGRGGEDMVVKPLTFIHKGRRGLSRPAVKCRGREYLRIIYGPDCTADENLSRLWFRGLGRKRSIALSESALGMAGLERFVR